MAWDIYKEICFFFTPGHLHKISKLQYALYDGHCNLILNLKCCVPLLWANSNQLLEHHCVDPDFWFWWCFSGKFAWLFMQHCKQLASRRLRRPWRFLRSNMLPLRSKQMCEVLGFWDDSMRLFFLSVRGGVFGPTPNPSDLVFRLQWDSKQAGKTGHTHTH